MIEWLGYLHPEFFIKPWYLMTIVVGMGALIFALFMYRIRYFQSSDPKPEILYRLPQKGSAFANALTDVNVGIYVKTFPEFSVLRNNFVVDAIVWFTFDPTAVTLAAMGDFFFDKGTIQEKQMSLVKKMGDLLFVEYEVRVEFSSNIDHTFFPLNDHKLYLMLIHNALSAYDAMFVSSRSGFLLSKECYLHGWLVIDREVETGYIMVAVDEYDRRKKGSHPLVVFTLAVTQMNLRNTSVIFVPLLLVYFISILALMLDPETSSTSIMRIATATIAAMLGYRFVIEKMSPEVSYFTLTDYLYTLLIGNTTAIFLFNIYSIHRGKWTEGLELGAGLLIMLVVGTTIATVYYLLFRWKRRVPITGQ